MEAAYGVFAQEADQLAPDYQPQTVNTDGWEATQAAWKNLFPQVNLNPLLFTLGDRYCSTLPFSRTAADHVARQTLGHLPRR